MLLWLEIITTTMQRATILTATINTLGKEIHPSVYRTQGLIWEKIEHVFVRDLLVSEKSALESKPVRLLDLTSS